MKGADLSGMGYQTASDKMRESQSKLDPLPGLIDVYQMELNRRKKAGKS